MNELTTSRYRRERDEAIKAARIWRAIAAAAMITSTAVCLMAGLRMAETEAEAAEPAPAAVVVVEDQEESQNIEDALLARAHRIDGVTVTHYCICERCCGKSPSDPGYGITASGRRATPGVSVAVDPDVIPLGATVLVDYGDGALHYYRADDTGAAILGACKLTSLMFWAIDKLEGVR